MSWAEYGCATRGRRKVIVTFQRRAFGDFLNLID